MRVAFWTFLVLVLASCASTGENVTTPSEATEPVVFEDDGGQYTVSASKDFYIGADTQTGQAMLVPLDTRAPLRTPRLTLEIRNYSSLTWGQRSRAVAKISWYDDTVALRGTVNVSLIDALTNEELVGWSEQPVNQIVPAGRTSRTVSYYSSYLYQPNTRLCVRGALELQAGDTSEFLTIDLTQQTCERVQQNISQDTLITSELFDLGDGDTADIAIYRNAKGQYRGVLHTWSPSGDWSIGGSDVNFLALRDLSGQQFTRVPFTLGFTGSGSSQKVTRYTLSVTEEQSLCIDANIKLRSGEQKLLSHCVSDGDIDDDNYTVILSDVVFSDDHRYVHIYEIHQHNDVPSLFRASVQYKPGDGQLGAQLFAITGYDGNGETEDTQRFTDYNEGTKQTNWIRSTEPGEEVCYQLVGEWITREFDEKTVRHSACVQMDDTTIPPTPLRSRAKFFALGAVELTIEGNQAYGRVVVQRLEESEDTTGVFAEATVNGSPRVSQVRVNTQFDEETRIETGDTNGGVFDVPVLTLSEPWDGACIEAELVTAYYDYWEHYFEPALEYGSVCIN